MNSHFVKAQINGIDLSYRMFGTGLPLLFLHGGLGNADYWYNQLPVFAETYKVIAIDSRGHGRSTFTEEPISYALMATDVIALLDTLSIERAAVMGWSDGGIIGLDVAIHHPERLRKLIAYGANYNPSGLRATKLPSNHQTIVDRFLATRSIPTHWLRVQDDARLPLDCRLRH